MSERPWQYDVCSCGRQKSKRRRQCAVCRQQEQRARRVVVSCRSCGKKLRVSPRRAEGDVYCSVPCRNRGRVGRGPPRCPDCRRFLTRAGVCRSCHTAPEGETQLTHTG